MNSHGATIDRDVTHFHLFAGFGGGAVGFNHAHARVGRLRARMRCLGGVDVDPGAIRDFGAIVGVPGTVLDLFDRQQYLDWHGHEPPAEWREATPADIRRAAGGEHPDIVFLSPPCKGFSGLLAGESAKSRKYAALNRLTVRGIALMLEAFASDPPGLVVLENVPRIATRGKALLEQIETVLRCHGYGVVGYAHNCGEVGGLAQNRHRFLLVARHLEKVPPNLYEPEKQRVRGVGEVLDQMPLPEASWAGPMHRLPRLQWRTWMRLALVTAGGDWRSLQQLEVTDDGYLRDIGVLPIGESFRGTYGVKRWNEVSGTVTGRSGSTTGAFSVADPRTPTWTSERTGRVSAYGQYGVVRFEDHSHTVTGKAAPGSGPFSVADPRANTGWGGKGKYRVTGMDDPAGTVIGGSTTGQGAFAVADPRLDCDAGDRTKRRFNNVYRVIRYDEASAAVTAGGGNSRAAVADPRPVAWREGRNAFVTGGHFGVVRFEDASRTVTGHAKQDRGPFSVADPRVVMAAAARPDPFPLIIALDETWHRPFTTLELAALQGFDWLRLTQVGLSGNSDSAWRERIGNAVPPPAAQAVGSVMAETILRAAVGESFALSARPVWVSPLDESLRISVSMTLGVS